MSSSKKTRWPLLGAYAALGAAVACAAIAVGPMVQPRGTSPAKDMPGEWFLHDAEQAAKDAELIGKPAPKIELEKWFQGERPVTPESLKGKVVLLDIWATWCAPCRAHMPKNDALARQFKDDLVVIGICSNGDEEEARSFIKEKALTIPMAWDKMKGEDGVTFTAFRAPGYPTYVAIDRQGLVRAIGIAPEHVEDVIKKLIEEKPGQPG